MSFLKIDNVSKRYGNVQAVDGISLDVKPGSRTAVVGPSGSGKTTLLRIIAGFEFPDHGRVILNDTLMADGPSIVPAHKRGIGIVSQDGALFPHLSVAENIAFGFERGAADRNRQIQDLMDMVELDRVMLDRRPHQLSGGQQQRVALARALGHKPRLMLLDEPFSALDTGLRENMRKAVARVLQLAGITTILVTHDQAEALSFADQVAVLRDGKLVQSGSPQEVYLTPKDRETALFLGDAILLSAEFKDGFADCALGRLDTGVDVRSGRGEIMLRPEQIRLLDCDEVQAGCRGTILDIEFGGAACTVAIAIADENGGQTLQLKTSSINLPPIGGDVRLSVIGRPHILVS